MIQHDQRHCAVCQRPTLCVRATYDTPHVGHLTFCGLLALASFVARPAALATLCGLAACAWLLLWGLHAMVNALGGGPAYRCATCGSTTSQAAGQADEQQRLARAMAKAAAKAQTR